MNIEWQKKRIVYNFVDLEVGETFKLMDQSPGCVYFKTQKHDMRNAVDLTDGRMVSFEYTEAVVKLQTKLIVES